MPPIDMQMAFQAYQESTLTLPNVRLADYVQHNYLSAANMLEVDFTALLLPL